MKLKAGFSLLAFFGVAAAAAPLIAPYSPYAQDLLRGLDTPTPAHPMGLDLLGRDILSRVIYGARVSFAAGFTVIAVSSLIGTLIGGVAAVWGGRLDMLLMRLVDVVQAFPGILLAIAVMAVLGPGFGNLLVALCLTGWAGFARLTRGQILSLREREYVTAAVAAGAGRWRILTRHLLPNAAAPLLVEAAFGMASVIVAEAGLSFLGLGVQPPEPSWGSMLNEGRAFLLIAPRLTVFPGLCLMLLALAVTLVGDALRDRLDVRRR